MEPLEQVGVVDAVEVAGHVADELGEGVEHAGAVAGLKENAWRSARELHAFRPVDRLLDTGRDPINGKITDFGARWKKHEVMPTTFAVSDTALEKPAIASIDQILHRPTVEYDHRQFTNGGLLL